MVWIQVVEPTRDPSADGPRRQSAIDVPAAPSRFPLQAMAEVQAGLETET